jgi:hypothetical protein
MKNVEEELQYFKQIPIRARFAYAMLCFESSMPIKPEAYPPLLKMVIDKAWEYTIASDLGKWHNDTNEIRPYCIMDDHPDKFKALETISRETSESLLEIYKQLPPISVEILDECFWLGYSPLYTSFEAGNEYNLKTFKSILARMEGIEKPSKERIALSIVEDKKGWGEKHDKEYWRGNTKLS